MVKKRNATIPINKTVGSSIFKQLTLIFPSEERQHIAIEGTGSLQSFSMSVALFEVGTQTPSIRKERSRFKNFGIASISDYLAEDTNEPGPYFVLVDQKNRIEEPTLKSRKAGSYIHTPTAFLGESHKKCNPPSHDFSGEWCDALIPDHHFIHSGVVIGRVTSDRESNEQTLTYFRRFEKLSIVSPLLRFDNIFQLPYSPKDGSFSNPYSNVISKDCILLVRTSPKEEIRFVYLLKPNFSSLVIPNLTLEDLEGVVHRVIKESEGCDPSSDDFDDDEDDEEDEE